MREWRWRQTKAGRRPSSLKIHRSRIFNSPPRTLHQFGYRIVLLECERFLSLLLSLTIALNAMEMESIEFEVVGDFNSERMSACCSLPCKREATNYYYTYFCNNGETNAMMISLLHVPMDGYGMSAIKQIII
eukprot:scaffold7912_cov104-Skeletonema_dohrnii-CCMP3373.AAC.7